MTVVRTYLEPTAPFAPDAIVVDDPKLAMDLAIAVCDSPKMSNLAHGLWGYHGITPEGAGLTVQSLGIGGPSAALVVSDLAGLGVTRAIRIGSCIAIDPGLTPAASVLASRFIPSDGAGLTLSRGRETDPDPDLTKALSEAIAPDAAGAICSTDLGEQEEAAGTGIALDMASAAFAGACARSGMACAAALTVVRTADGRTLVGEAADEALIGLGKRASAALSAVPQASGP